MIWRQITVLCCFFPQAQDSVSIKLGRKVGCVKKKVLFLLDVCFKNSNHLLIVWNAYFKLKSSTRNKRNLMKFGYTLYYLKFFCFPPVYILLLFLFLFCSLRSLVSITLLVYPLQGGKFVAITKMWDYWFVNLVCFSRKIPHIIRGWVKDTGKWSLGL